MKTSSSIFIFLLVLPSGHAQGGFDSIYDDGNSLAFLGIQCLRDTLYVYGVSYPDESALQHIYAAKVDTLGTVHNTITFGDPEGKSHLTLQQYSSGSLVSNYGEVIIPVDFVPSTSIGILKLTSRMKIQAFEQYDVGDNKVTVIGSIVRTRDGGYMATGYAQRSDFSIDIVVLKTDSLGEKEWLKYYGENNLAEERAFGIRQKEENEFLLYGVKNSGTNSSGHITAIDSLGTIKWEWTASDTGIARSLVRELRLDKETKDWVYMSLTFRKTTYPGEGYDVWAPVFVRRDSLMNLKYAKVLGPHAISHFFPGMIQTRDGGWSAVGSTTNTTDDYVSPLASSQARIAKLTNSGEVVWSVQDTAFFHPVHGSTSRMNGVAEASTGSIYAVGYASHPNEKGLWRDYGWLIKVTADGCIDTLCTTTSLLDQLERLNTPVDVYPNPATEHLIFDIKETHEDLQIALFDLHGRLLQAQESRPGTHVVMLNENFTSSGLYVWRVMTEGGRILGTGKFVLSSE